MKFKACYYLLLLPCYVKEIKNLKIKNFDPVQKKNSKKNNKGVLLFVFFFPLLLKNYLFDFLNLIKLAQKKHMQIFFI
jgi:hypothetical protein